jgi:hypothetical protein
MNSAAMMRHLALQECIANQIVFIDTVSVRLLSAVEVLSLIESGDVSRVLPSRRSCPR